MRSYQSVIILKPDLDEAQVELATQKITNYIAKYGGSVIKSEVWGKKRLAYRVKKNRFGIYLNVCHTCENLKVIALENDFRLYETIVKFLVIRLEKKDLERVLLKKAQDDLKKADEADDEALAGGSSATVN